jgi:methyl-accepting chemotaxis protein
MEPNLKMKKQGKGSGITDANITKRIEEIEERISGVEDIVEHINTTVKENSKHKNLITHSIQEIQDTMKRPSLRIIRMERRRNKGITICR